MHESWYSTSRCYVAILSVIYFMKMHSYTVENQKYRRDKDKKASNYPNNITWRNFARFMFIPVVIYKFEYPTTKFRP